MSCVLLNVFLDILGVFLLYFCHFSLLFLFFGSAENFNFG